MTAPAWLTTAYPQPGPHWEGCEQSHPACAYQLGRQDGVADFAAQLDALLVQASTADDPDARRFALREARIMARRLGGLPPIPQEDPFMVSTAETSMQNLKVYAGYAVALHVQDLNPGLPIIVAATHRGVLPPPHAANTGERRNSAYGRHTAHGNRAWTYWIVATAAGVYMGGFGAPRPNDIPVAAREAIFVPYEHKIFTDAPVILFTEYIERVQAALRQVQTAVVDSREQHIDEKDRLTLSRQVLNRVRRHNGGRAALRLLAEHDGPDLLTKVGQTPEEQELHAELRAEVERLRAERNTAVATVAELAQRLITREREHNADRAARDRLQSELEHRDQDAARWRHVEPFLTRAREKGPLYLDVDDLLDAAQETETWTGEEKTGA